MAKANKDLRSGPSGAPYQLLLFDFSGFSLGSAASVDKRKPVPVLTCRVDFGRRMPTLVRELGATIALVAFLGGMAGVRPCLDDDDCAMSCSTSAALSCPASGEHRDPVVPAHSCECMCHVPGLAVELPVETGREPVVDDEPVVLGNPLRQGFLDSPFRPPRA